MAAEVLSHHQVPTKPEEASRPDAEAASSTKRNYVPIRPAYRPLLPKPTTRDSAPSPIHIHTRTSGLSQLACRKRHSGMASKIDASKRRRSLASRASEQAHNAAHSNAKAESKSAASSSPSLSGSSRSSPSPTSSSAPSPSGMDSPSLTSVSTRSIFGPPPSQSLDPLPETSASSGFDAEAMRPSMADSMTSMMSAIVNRSLRTTRASESGASGDSSMASVSISDLNSRGQTLFSQQTLNEFDGMPLELDQLNKLDAELESSITTTASVAASLAPSAASSLSDNGTGSLDIVSAMPEDLKKRTGESPDTYAGYGSPTDDFDEFTDLYFHSSTQVDSVTPTDGSPDTLGDVLDTEVGFCDKGTADEFNVMDFLAPVDLFNA